MKKKEQSSTEAFRAVFSEYLLTNGITQTALSSTTGASEGYVSLIMNGHRAPSENFVTAAVNQLNIPDPVKTQLYYTAAKAQWPNLPDLPELDLTKK